MNIFQYLQGLRKDLWYQQTALILRETAHGELSFNSAAHFLHVHTTYLQLSWIKLINIESMNYGMGETSTERAHV